MIPETVHGMGPHTIGHIFVDTIIILKCIWSPSLREQLALNAEDDNTNDCRAVVVIKIDAVVGHLPRETAKSVRSTVGTRLWASGTTVSFVQGTNQRVQHACACVLMLLMCVYVNCN